MQSKNLLQTLALLFGLSFPALTLAAAPTVDSFTPSDDSSNVARDTNLTIDFDQTVVASGGTITITDTGLGQTWETIIASGSKVTISSDVVTINPSRDFNGIASIAIQIAADAFENASNESYAGISDNTTWNFTARGGSASQHRDRLRKLRENQPQYYDREPPDPSSVGIFVPGSSGSDGEAEEAGREDETDASDEHGSAPEQEIDEQLQRARERRRQRLLAAASQQAQTEDEEEESSQDLSSLPAHLQRLHDRVCRRVERRFAGNEKMIARVNRRLRNRFSFICELE